MRPGEISVPVPPHADAHLLFIGRIHTPWRTRHECPRHGDAEQGPECRIEVDEAWLPALSGLEAYPRIEVLYWMHQSRRDLVVQAPRRRSRTAGTFALRSPVRPNPIATSVVDLIAISGTTLLVRGLDCIDGTPLLDIKPERYPRTPPGPVGAAAKAPE